MTQIAADAAGGIELLVVAPDMLADIALCPKRNTFILLDIEGGAVNGLEPLECVVFYQLLQFWLGRESRPAICTVL
jgi:hypothetical protein